MTSTKITEEHESIYLYQNFFCFGRSSKVQLSFNISLHGTRSNAKMVNKNRSFKPTITKWTALKNNCSQQQQYIPTISDANYWDKVSSWKHLWKFWNGPLWRNKSGLFLLLIVARYCKGSNTEACVKKKSQILANNTDHGGRVIGLRICVRDCLKK